MAAVLAAGPKIGHSCAVRNDQRRLVMEMSTPAEVGRRQTLRGRFLRITIPLIFLSVIAVFAVVEMITHRNAVNRLDQVLSGVIQTQAAALANPLWNLDDDQIRLTLEAIVTNREILTARVVGEDGSLIAKAGVVPPDGSQSDLIRLSREITHDAGAGSREIGALELVATRELVWARTVNRLLFAALVALVAVTIEVTAALYALRTIIGQPLARLLGSINRARSGETREQVDWNSTDELGQVIAAYNEMQSQQLTHERDLLAARDTLEERVRERTSELAVARDDSVRAWTRLDDAINAISEGFSLYGPDDCLVVSNTRYREILHAGDATIMVPGQSFDPGFPG